MDAYTNLAISTIATAPSPASSGTTMAVASGEGSRFPAVPFNATIHPAGQIPTPSNAEIVRITAMTGDSITAMTRTQEGTSPRSIAIGDQIIAAITKKTLDDINGNVSKVTRTSGSFSTSSTSFVDVTGLSITMDTRARRCLVNLIAWGEASFVDGYACVTLDIDGTNEGGVFGITSIRGFRGASLGVAGPFSFSYVTDVLSAGSHTFKIRIRATDGSGNAQIYGDSAVSPSILSVLEL